MDKLWNLLMKWDLFLDKIFRPITKLWCKVTGRDNTSLARLSLVVGCLCIQAQNGISYFTDSSILNRIICIVGVIIWVVIMLFDWSNYGKYRALQDDPGDLMNINPITLITHLKVRVTLWAPFCLLQTYILIIVALNAGLALASLGFILVGMSMYFALHINPGGKKLWDRIKDKTKAGLEKVKSLIPSPLPAPIPLPVGV